MLSYRAFFTERREPTNDRRDLFSLGVEQKEVTGKKRKVSPLNYGSLFEKVLGLSAERV